MNKPERKRPGAVSTLVAAVEPLNIGGVSEESTPVVVPPAPVAAPVVALAAVETVLAAVEAPEAEAPAAEPEVEPDRKPVTVRLEVDLIEQAKAAVYASRMDVDGFDTFQDLVETAVMKEVELQAQRHNQGEPFTPLPKFRRGRPFNRN